MRFQVDEQHDGVLLRSYLKGTLRVSTRLLTRLKNHPEGIKVNGEHVTVRRLLRAGDTVEIAEWDDTAQGVFRPEPLSFGILYEDEHLLIVDKPPRMPTHPSNRHDGDTLANALAYHYGTRGIPFVFRPVSRLDRNTSGILTLAKDQYTASMLCEQMKRREMHKTYLAIVHGQLPEHEGRIETGIRRITPGIVLRETCDVDAEGAELAVTEYRVLRENEAYSFVELHALTGRTHQLRVQLASLGCSIVGDGLYGTDEPCLERHALHATALELTHPYTNERMHIVSPLPEDLNEYLRRVLP